MNDQVQPDESPEVADQSEPPVLNIHGALQVIKTGGRAHREAWPRETWLEMEVSDERPDRIIKVTESQGRPIGRVLYSAPLEDLDATDWAEYAPAEA